MSIFIPVHFLVFVYVCMYVCMYVCTSKLVYIHIFLIINFLFLSTGEV